MSSESEAFYPKRKIKFYKLTKIGYSENSAKVITLLTKNNFTLLIFVGIEHMLAGRKQQTLDIAIKGKVCGVSAFCRVLSKINNTFTYSFSIPFSNPPPLIPQ